MSYLGSKDFFLEVAKGNVAKHSFLHLFSRNSNVGTTAEDVVPQSAVWVSPTASRIHNIVSTSANDSSAGTGARTIKIEGISGGNIVEETITMNGTTNVATVNSYTNIYEMEVLTWGSTLTNVGAISATAQTDLTVTCLMPATENESNTGIFQVPNGYKVYLLQWFPSFQNVTSNCLCDFKLLYKQGINLGWETEDFIGLKNDATSAVAVDFKGVVFQPGTYIKTQVLSTVTGTDAQVRYQYILIQD